MSKLTGHNKSFIQKNMEVNEFMDCYTFTAGTIQYDTWLSGGHIYTQYFLGSYCQGSWYHDFKTLDYDCEYTEKIRRKYEKEMIEEAIANREI